MKERIIIGSVFFLVVLFLSVFIWRAGDKSTKKDVTDNEKSMEPTRQQGELKTEDIKVGEGTEVKKGDTVVMHYKGTLTDGTQFDSSYDRGEPYETVIGVGQVIAGWDKGVPGMKIGGKPRLTIPPEMGYGESGSGPIPPNATLIFEVELIEIK